MLGVEPIAIGGPSTALRRLRIDARGPDRRARARTRAARRQGPNQSTSEETEGNAEDDAGERDLQGGQAARAPRRAGNEMLPAMWHRLAVALVVVVVLAASRPAAAETVRGYVYVNAASYVRTTHRSQANECWVTVRVPATAVAQPPASDDLSPLAHATRIGVTVSDPFDNCTDYIHTWQLATYDPARRDHVDIDWPAGRPSIVLILIGVALVIVIGGYGLGRARARRARARRSVQRA